MSRGWFFYCYTDSTYSGETDITANNVRDNSTKTGESNSNTSGSSGSVTSQPPNAFYYYVNKSTAARIKAARRTASDCKVLLTTMEPERFSEDQILKSLYGEYYDRNLYVAFADWCVKIDASTLDMSKLTNLRPQVYEYGNAIDVRPTDVIVTSQRENVSEVTSPIYTPYTHEQQLDEICGMSAGESIVSISRDTQCSESTIQSRLPNNYNDHKLPLQSLLSHKEDIDTVDSIVPVSEFSELAISSSPSDHQEKDSKAS